MYKISENDGILGKVEYEQFKTRSINLKFFGQMFAAIGGATFFGLLMATANGLLDIAALHAAGATAIATAAAEGAITTYGGALAATIFSGPALGFIVLGAACIYMAQRFFYESTVLDQDFQAKKIAFATSHAQALGIEQSAPAHSHTNTTTPPGMTEHTLRAHEDHAPAMVEGKWAEKVPHRAHADKHADVHAPKPEDRSIPKPHVDSWAETVRSEEQHQTEHTGHTIH